jgi:hypothetical protein
MKRGRLSLAIAAISVPAPALSPAEGPGRLPRHVTDTLWA